MQKGYLWILVPGLLLVAAIVINIDTEGTGDEPPSPALPLPDPPSNLLPERSAEGVLHTPPVEPNCAGKEVLVGLLVEDSLSLERGDARVRQLQRKLREEGLFRGVVDGVLGTNTRVAIYRYQQRGGTCPSGYVDDAVADLLEP